MKKSKFTFNKLISYFFLLLLILPELVIIIFLVQRINKQQLNSVDTFIEKKQYYVYDSQNYKYYYELKPNLHKISDLTNIPNWLTEKAYYNTNKDGLSSIKDYTIHKSRNTYRIAALGDSFTMGLFVSTEQAWPQDMEKQLNTHCNSNKQFEVLNLGIGGYDAVYEAERFKLKGLKYQPDMLIWLLKDEDFEWIDEWFLPLFNMYEKGIPATTDLNSPKWVNVWKNVEQDYNIHYGKEKSITFAKQALITLGREYKGKIIILNLPQYSTDKEVNSAIISFVHSRPNTYFYNQLPDILRLKATYPETHPNAVGYKLIAKNLDDFLRSSNLIKCKY